MKVRWTDEALGHLDSIYQHIAADSPVYALRMVDKLTRSQQIGDFPLSGRQVPEYEEYKVREVIETLYRIICRLASNDHVDVLAVIPGARLLPDALRENHDL